MTHWPEPEKDVKELPEDEPRPVEHGDTLDLGTAANVGCELESDDDDQTEEGLVDDWDDDAEAT